MVACGDLFKAAREMSIKGPAEMYQRFPNACWHLIGCDAAVLAADLSRDAGALERKIINPVSDFGDHLTEHLGIVAVIAPG